MLETSEITIIPEGFITNVSFIKSRINKHVELCSVIKGNAYGHGIETFVPMALKAGINSFAVYSSDEAIRVKPLIPNDARLIVMGAADGAALQWCIENKIEFYVFNFTRLSDTIRISKQLGTKARIHIEIETGMFRTGFSELEIKKLIEIISSNQDYIEFSGLCTHFAGAELSANIQRINSQIELFLKIKKLFSASGCEPKITHACCSAAMMKLENMHFDLVRIGILQYGYWPSREMEIEYKVLHPEFPNPLKRIIEWKSKVMSITNVPEGSWIGYGESFAAQHKMKIAVVPVGYAHGYARSLSNVGQVLIGGNKVPVLGMVNMNCISVDVTLVNDIKVNDDVVLIGKQGDEEISVASFSERSEQLNYELLTRLPASIPRTLAKELWHI
jgi:alanine racemase